MSTEKFDIFLKMCSEAFESLIGIEFYFYGVNQRENTFKLDDMTFGIMPGETLYKGVSCVYQTADACEHYFYKRPLTKVKIQQAEQTETRMISMGYGETMLRKGYDLVDEDGHIWLHFEDGWADVEFVYTPKKDFELIDVPDDYPPSFFDANPDVVIKYLSWFNGSAPDFHRRKIISMEE